jgi:hypothetical protein
MTFVRSTSLFLLAYLFFTLAPSVALGSPDAMFKVSYENGYPLASQSPASSWGSTYNYSYAGTTGTSQTSGSVSGNALTATNAIVMNAPVSSGGVLSGAQYVQVYVIGHSSGWVALVNGDLRCTNGDSRGCENWLEMRQKWVPLAVPVFSRRRQL